MASIRENNNNIISDSDDNKIIALAKKSLSPETTEQVLSDIDYYDFILNKSGLALMDDENIDLDLEIDKSTDEIIILSEVKKFVDESKELLNEIKTDIDNIQSSMTDRQTVEQINALDDKYCQIKNKLDKLKKQYIIMKDKYEFEDYDLLNNIRLIIAIDDFHNKAKIDELDSLVDACKNEVAQIEDVLIEEKRRILVGDELSSTKHVIVGREKEFNSTEKEAINLKYFQEKIAEEAKFQQEIVDDLEKEMNRIEMKINDVSHYIFNTRKLFSSFLRITMGILTLPLNNKSIFGIMMGTALINNGLKKFKESMTPQKILKDDTRNAYVKIDKEIITTQDMVGTTLKMIDDCIEQLDSLKQEFKMKFQDYALYIPNYYNVQNMMSDLEKNLLQKKENVVQMREVLNKQHEKSKRKILS